MPNLYAGDIQDNDEIYRSGLDYISLPWRDALAAKLKNTWYLNPIVKGFEDASELYAQQPAARPGIAGMMGELAGDETQTFARLQGQDPAPAQPDSADNIIDTKTLNQKYGKYPGITFDHPMRSGAVDIMVDRQYRDNDLQAKIDHAPQDLTYRGASLLLSLGVAATDPLNIAASFVPVVGEARAALWAARYGKTLARIGEGAIEGGVGQAALEPLNIADAEIFHDQHYGPMDSFLNVAFGSILGGGLHTGFGAISDLMGRVSSETREQTLRTAVAQMADGRDVQVDHVIASDPAAMQAGSVAEFTTSKGSTYQWHEDGTTTRDKAARDDIGHEGQSGPQPQSEATYFVTKEQADELGLFQTQGASGKMAIERRPDGTIGVRYVDGPNAGKFEARTVTMPSTSPQVGLVPVETWKSGTRVHFGNEITQVRPQATVDASGTPVRTAIDKARSDTLAASRGEKPSGAVSPNASKSAAETVKLGQGDDLGAELEEANRRLSQYQAQGLLTPEEVESAKASEVTEEANNRSKAADAAAICLRLHP